MRIFHSFIAFLLLVLLFISSCSAMQSALIYRIKTLNILFRSSLFFGPNDLIIFDVDGVLLQLNEFSRYGCSLIELQSPYGIKRLQQTKARIIALTALQTGLACSSNLILEDWRVCNLRHYGIDFSESSPLRYWPPDESQLLESDELLFGYAESTPALVKEGVVCSARYTKGSVLYDYLMAIKDWRPKRIIFIDDFLENHESVEATCRVLGIEFIGLHYDTRHDSELLTDEQAQALFAPKVSQDEDSCEDPFAMVLDPFEFSPVNSGLETSLLPPQGNTTQLKPKSRFKFECRCCSLM